MNCCGHSFSKRWEKKPYKQGRRTSVKWSLSSATKQCKLTVFWPYQQCSKSALLSSFNRTAINTNLAFPSWLKGHHHEEKDRIWVYIHIYLYFRYTSVYMWHLHFSCSCSKSYSCMNEIKNVKQERETTPRLTCCNCFAVWQRCLFSCLFFCPYFLRDGWTWAQIFWDPSKVSTYETPSHIMNHCWLLFFISQPVKWAVLWFQISQWLSSHTVAHAKLPCPSLPLKQGVRMWAKEKKAHVV